MAHVSGPVTTMPGTIYPLPAGSTCDEHPDRQAVVRIQGETDSKRVEYIDMCQECYGRFQLFRSDDHPGTCDRCGQFAETLRKYRDRDEGLAGRIYDVCEKCKAENAEYIAVEEGAGSEFEPDESEPSEQPTDFADLDYLGPNATKR